jgi:simple sugar transport system ATP-binding protein
MIRLMQQPVADLGPGARRRLGLGLVPEERLGRGAVPGMTLTANMLLSHQEPPYVKRGMVDFAYTRNAAAAVIDRFKVKTGGALALAKSLSGGNLQKFIVGREIARAPLVFVVAQPTWGVDVGAAAQIHDEILTLRQQGCAVLIISEELDELFDICDRLHVIANGRLSPPVSAADATREQIGLWMSGLWTEPPPAPAAPQAETAHA